MPRYHLVLLALLLLPHIAHSYSTKHAGERHRRKRTAHVRSIAEALGDAATVAADPLIWPLPQHYVLPNSNLTVGALTLQTESTSKILTEAFDRYVDIIFAHELPVSAGPMDIHYLSVTIYDNDETLQQGTDESYSLHVADVTTTITAQTVYGALRALETLSQLIVYDFNNHAYVVGNWDIKDFPRFSFRGLLVDTSRHFLPVATLKHIIDSMSFAKLNVLHWHAVDAQSFPLESISFPHLWDGSYAEDQRYTVLDMQEVVRYAKQRGVRVMIEFDGPGHTYAWGVGYPQLLPSNWSTADGCDDACPRKAGIACNVPLDPSNNFTYEVLKGLYSDMIGDGDGQGGIFTEQFFHLGGDEVQTGCWKSSTAIAEFMKEQGFSSYDQLYMYFVKRAHSLVLSMNRSPVCWEEVFNHFGETLDKRTVVHVWISHATLLRVVAAGYKGILSDAPTWYLDALGRSFTSMYLNDPHEGISDPTQQALVLGGETCMWGETADTSDVLQTIWPRAAAVAERLWSAQSVNDVDRAMPRYQWFRCLLNGRGVEAAPVFQQGRGPPPGPGSCYTQ